uniref:Uncharacterized protein n=1 Tax=Panagrolaimus sp. JU765 TaxID=591449 RepID=A0AC34QR95_9BILA
MVILYNFFKEKKIPVEYLHYQSLLQRSGTRSGACKIPQLNPWDQTIMSYFSKPDRIQCKPFLLDVTHLDENGILTIDPDFVEKVNCDYRYFFKNEGVDDDNLEYDEWATLGEKGVKLAKEFVEVNCVKLAKEFVEVNCVTKSILSGSYTYHWAHLKPKTANIKKQPILEESIEKPSVIMIGLDSMSRSNFVRQLPHTYQYLQENGFIDLQSHVKVADNTFNNWLAILTGKLGTKTREFDAELPDEFHLWFDDWDFIWKNYSKHGYATFFAEDRVDIATFNYMGKQNGFRRSPVDHYFRPFWLSCYWSLTFRRSTTGCYDRRPLHEIQFEYLSEFLKGYENKRKFAWWWTQDLSHDDLNKIGAIDLDFREFLEKHEKLLEKSIVIVFSDHGHRYAEIRETVIGRLEARLPFLTIRIPKELREKHSWIVENLKLNSKTMTTQYDLHQTLLHVLDKFDKENDAAKPTKI